MKAVFWLEFQIYIDNEENFDPFEVYRIIGLKPTFCKKHQKNPIGLLNRKWKENLCDYLQSPQEYIQDSEELVPLEFYKITSSVLDSKDFKKSINSFTKKLSSKNNELDIIRKKYSSLFYFEIIIKDYIDKYFSIPKETLKFCVENNIEITIECVS